jgi:ribosome-binding ATPase YchF (GTP1/OBG family)
MKAYLVKMPVTETVMIGLVLGDKEVLLTRAEAHKLQSLVDTVVAAASKVGGQQWSKAEEQQLKAGEIVFTA